MSYLISSGYWSGKGFRGQDGSDRADFFKIWLDNTFAYASPQKIIVVDSNSEILPPDPEDLSKVEWIKLNHNFGHVFDMVGSGYQNKFGGWSVGFLVGAMMAYANNCDFIYKEQDCLCFGSWVESLYNDLEKFGKRMLIGRQSHPAVLIEQSLVIIKHDFILDFIQKLISINKPDGGEGRYVPEFKFYDLLCQNSEIGLMSMGYGRQKSFNFDEAFYTQQPSVENLKLLVGKGLIPFSAQLPNMNYDS